MLLKMHWFSSHRQQKVNMFEPKFVGPFRVMEVVHNNLIIEVEGETSTANFDQVRDYKFMNNNVSSRMSSGESQLPRSLKSSTNACFLSQHVRNGNFRSPRKFSLKNKLHASFLTNSI